MRARVKFVARVEIEVVRLGARRRPRVPDREHGREQPAAELDRVDAPVGEPAPAPPAPGDGRPDRVALCEHVARGVDARLAPPAPPAAACRRGARPRRRRACAASGRSRRSRAAPRCRTRRRRPSAPRPRTSRARRRRRDVDRAGPAELPRGRDRPAAVRRVAGREGEAHLERCPRPERRGRRTAARRRSPAPTAPICHVPWRSRGPVPDPLPEPDAAQYTTTPSRSAPSARTRFDLAGSLAERADVRVAAAVSHLVERRRACLRIGEHRADPAEERRTADREVGAREWVDADVRASGSSATRRGPRRPCSSGQRGASAYARAAQRRMPEAPGRDRGGAVPRLVRLQQQRARARSRRRRHRGAGRRGVERVERASRG